MQFYAPEAFAFIWFVPVILALAWLSRSSGVIGDIARLASIGVAGAAGAILWRYHADATPPPEKARPKRKATAKTKARSSTTSATK